MTPRRSPSLAAARKRVVRFLNLARNIAVDLDLTALDW